MTPQADGEPKFERIDCELAEKGILDRISVSPSESKTRSTSPSSVRQEPGPGQRTLGLQAFVVVDLVDADEFDVGKVFDLDSAPNVILMDEFPAEECQRYLHHCGCHATAT